MHDDDWYKPHPNRPAALPRQPKPGEEATLVRRWLLAAAYICGSIIGVFAAYAISPILGYLAILPATVFIWAAIGGTYRRLLGDKDTTADVMRRLDKKN